MGILHFFLQTNISCAKYPWSLFRVKNNYTNGFPPSLNSPQVKMILGLAFCMGENVQ